ncbi:hypothetical protein Ddye_009943 [Dipteronia dyeriana]|uniref:Uncharacterized protein n=1 Tax=Dipteronia dyeriana TaxID=168575 RepID=A0AAE0CMT5_9ROSI|nr:hypothetical protein Ddye_009943 [Dipteronia dyeriana]
MIDKMTFMIKTLEDGHECHRVYNNKEAKVKWIASKFENLMKTNPSVSVKVIGDLLRENYKVSMNVQRLYNAKKRALAGLAKDHANCFDLLRRYAYMVNQSNPESTMSGIPCTYAMDAINHYCGKSVMKDNISDFVHQSLSKSAYLQTYRGLRHREKGNQMSHLKEEGLEPLFVRFVQNLATTKGPAREKRALCMRNENVQGFVYAK